MDGLVALPADPKTVEAFDWLADEVIEAGGEAWTWRGQPGSKAQQNALQERMAQAIVAEYQHLLDEANAVPSPPTRRTVERLRRELRRIEARDHNAPSERDEARRAIERLAGLVEVTQGKAVVR